MHLPRLTYAWAQFADVEVHLLEVGTRQAPGIQRGLLRPGRVARKGGKSFKKDLLSSGNASAQTRACLLSNAFFPQKELYCHVHPDGWYRSPLVMQLVLHRCEDHVGVWDRAACVCAVWTLSSSLVSSCTAVEQYRRRPAGRAAAVAGANECGNRNVHGQQPEPAGPLGGMYLCCRRAARGETRKPPFLLPWRNGG